MGSCPPHQCQFLPTRLSLVVLLARRPECRRPLLLVLESQIRPGNGFVRRPTNEAIGRYPLEDNGLRWSHWVRLRAFPPFVGRLPRLFESPHSWCAELVPGGGSQHGFFPGSPVWKLWNLLADGCNPHNAKKLATVFRWLRFLHSRRLLGAGCVVQGRCLRNPADLRPPPKLCVRRADQSRPRPEPLSILPCFV